MSYSVDKDKAYKAAKESLEWIYNWRKDEIEKAINREIADSKKWHKRIPFLFKEITRDQALDRIKSAETLFSEFTLIEMTYGRMEDAMKNIVKACKNNSGNTIHIGEKDFKYLSF